MNDWNVYPRPCLKRKDNFEILNEGWTLNGCAINVPFPPEAELSGFKGELTESYVYEKDFLIPDAAVTLLNRNGRLILHFGAVDQVCSVFVENEEVSHSELGYFAIDCDISEQTRKAIKAGKKSLQIKVKGEDFLDQNKPYGKQKKDRGGMWYTPVSGIWQTVWCEWVPENYISKIECSSKGSIVQISVNTNVDLNKKILVSTDDAADKNDFSVLKGVLKLSEGDYEFSFEKNKAVIDLSKLQKPQFWSSENPNLYEFCVCFGEDEIESYFALRDISIEEVDGFKRICLNGKPVFLNGVLDQGYYEKSLFIPESPEEYKKDILRMKELGFNTLRKHIKVEPELFYYACDKLGMFVLQDMVNNGLYKFGVDTILGTLGFKLNDKNRYKNQLQKEWFIVSAFETLNVTHNHPCVIGYTVFNEGWGQTDSDEIGDMLKQKDSSRFYDYTSGWFAQKNSDVESLHVYFRTKKLKAKNKPLILSEFGGFTRKIDNHVWNKEKSYGYGKCESEEELTEKIIETYRKMVEAAIPKGLCGAIYTQLSDIEDEINGFYTYDREICKVNKEKIKSYMENLKI